MVVAIIALTGLILLPRLAREKQRSQRIACTSNLKQIGLSFKTWALDHHDLFPMQVLTNQEGATAPGFGAFAYFAVMSNELYSPRVLLCPADSRRVFATNFSSNLDNSKISYFVGLDASDSLPQMFLSGDRNLTNGTPIVNGVLYLATNRPAGWTHELHNRQGNLGLADGSVQQFNDLRLRESGTAGRLAMP